MAYLSSLSFITAPQKSYDPKQVRRQKLIERLEEQKRLAADPNFIPVVKRWKKNPDGSKSIFDHYRRLKPWYFDPTEPRWLHVVRPLEQIDGSVTKIFAFKLCLWLPLRAFSLRFEIFREFFSHRPLNS